MKKCSDQNQLREEFENILSNSTLITFDGPMEYVKGKLYSFDSKEPLTVEDIEMNKLGLLTSTDLVEVINSSVSGDMRFVKIIFGEHTDAEIAFQIGTVKITSPKLRFQTDSLYGFEGDPASVRVFISTPDRIQELDCTELNLDIVEYPIGEEPI